MSHLIVGFGEALVDVLPSGEVVGGAPLNFSVRAAQFAAALGWQAALISRIGSDPRGEKIFEHLQHTGLDLSALQVDAQLASGYVEVTLDHGHPSYVIGEQVAWDQIVADEQALNLSRAASAFCFGTLAQRSPQTAAALRQCLAAADKAVKIFDINLRQPYPGPELIEASLRQADVLKCNEQELLWLAQWFLPETGLLPAAGLTAPAPAADHTSVEPTPAAQIAAQLQSTFGLSAVFWTRGSLGCVLQRGEKLTMADVPQLPQAAEADAVGAGDAASAALAVGLVAQLSDPAQWPDAKIVAMANYGGAWAASQRGATPPFPADFLKKLLSADTFNAN
jgi:fructokinase